MTDNEIHSDFDIYSSLNDAINDQNPWQYCSFDDSDVGFPRHCSPTGAVEGLWTSLIDKYGAGV